MEIDSVQILFCLSTNQVEPGKDPVEHYNLWMLIN